MRAVVRFTLLCAWVASVASASALANTPAEETRALLLGGQPRAAIAYGRAQIRLDSAQVELRTALGWAYIVRDMICVPLPVTAESFRMVDGPLHCDAPFFPPATQDTVMGLFETAAALSQGSAESRLGRLEFAYRFGPRAELEPALAAAAAADSVATATRLGFLLRATARAMSGAAAARYLAVVYADSLNCASRSGLVTALLRDGDFATAGPLARKSVAGGCDSTLVEPYIDGLASYGRYRELWDYTRSSPAPEAEVYFRHALVAALAAAHFDLPAARDRLAHETRNATAYPAPAREVLKALATLLDAEPAPAEAWTALAGHPQCDSPGYETVRLLIHTHALRLDPKRIDSADAVTAELERRFLARPAGECQERLAAALEAADAGQAAHPAHPARERALRRAAQGFFRAEADRECRAALARIAVKEPADWLLDGAAAFRLGERTAAMAALDRAQEPVVGGPPALPWTAKRLHAAAAGLSAR